MFGQDLLILLVVALVVVLFWRGPKMLPKIGEALGRTVKDTRAEVDQAFKKGNGGPDSPSS
jgi:Sec-independent protein translocase protein TatA